MPTWREKLHSGQDLARLPGCPVIWGTSPIRHQRRPRLIKPLLYTAVPARSWRLDASPSSIDAHHQVRGRRPLWVAEHRSEQGDCGTREPNMLSVMGPDEQEAGVDGQVPYHCHRGDVCAKGVVAHQGRDKSQHEPQSCPQDASDPCCSRTRKRQSGGQSRPCTCASLTSQQRTVRPRIEVGAGKRSKVGEGASVSMREDPHEDCSGIA